MSKSSAPDATPKPKTGAVKPKSDPSAIDQRSVFITAVLDMTWQLAIVVLLPIIGGYELDKVAGTSPLFVAVGFLLAMAGVFVVLRRMLQQLNQRFIVGGKR